MVVRDLSVSPPVSSGARKLLNDAVSAALPSQATPADLVQPNNVVTVGNHDLQLDGRLSKLQ